ncbi:MAG TPA: isoaspartyl peptidase/L-asparaginase [Ignavibacteriaceae bacterium]|nr:isoaspartyl peptidase/L-asparaginase [Ignavibacteriaceae bacterium]
MNKYFAACVLLSLSILINITAQTGQPNGKYVLVIHGGAGAVDATLPDSIKNFYYSSLEEALKIGEKILKENGTSLDAVEHVIRYLEDNPYFNAGKGAVLTSAGEAELDASIMDGKDLSCGAVSNVKTVKNPISLARKVMEKTPHVMLTSEGAEKFAAEINLELVEKDYFITPRVKNNYEKGIKRLIEEKKGTVGVVALDKKGNLAAGTSTGGMMLKMPGRVGDSPIIGAGTYADNRACAVSCTGRGEQYIKHAVAFNVSALMLYKNLPLAEAVNEIFTERLNPNDGGLIAVDKDGNYVMHYNTQSMFRGVVTSGGVFETKIWE